MELLQSNLEFLWIMTSYLLLIFLVEKVSFMKVYQSTIRYVPTVDILVAEASILPEYALLFPSFYA